MNKKQYKKKIIRIKNRLASSQLAGLTKEEYFDLRACLENYASDEQLRILKISIDKWLNKRIERYSSISNL